MVNSHPCTMLSFIFDLLLVLVFGVLNTNSDSIACYQLSMEPDRYTNDLSWYMYQNFKNGSQALLDSGGGDLSSPIWKSDCVYADSDECFSFTVVDSYGDGFCCNLANGIGYVNITYGNMTQRIYGRIYSDQYVENGVGNIPANETYIFENGEWVQYCRFGDPSPAQGCGISSPSIDIVFVFDTSFSMSEDVWRETLFARYILSDNVPIDTRAAAVTYGTDVERIFNLTQNSESLREELDDIETLRGQQMTSYVVESIVIVFCFIFLFCSPSYFLYLLLLLLLEVSCLWITRSTKTKNQQRKKEKKTKKNNLRNIF